MRALRSCAGALAAWSKRSRRCLRSDHRDQSRFIKLRISCARSACARRTASRFTASHCSDVILRISMPAPLLGRLLRPERAADAVVHSRGKSAVMGDVLDGSAGHADVGEHAVVKRPQLFDATANPVLVPDPGLTTTSSSRSACASCLRECEPSCANPRLRSSIAQE